MQSFARSFARGSLRLHRPARIFNSRSTITTSTFRMSSTTTSPTSQSSTPSKTLTPAIETSHKTLLALPAIPSHHDADTNTTSLDMSSGNATLKLDHLGPMVVNVDGTLSRISNWDKMAEIEKRNTVRIIGKRNKERLEVLKAKEGIVDEKGEGSGEGK